MATRVRLRLTFDDPDILSQTQKRTGLDRCWIMVSPDHHFVADVAAYIVDSFALHHSCPDGVLLYVRTLLRMYHRKSRLTVEGFQQDPSFFFLSTVDDFVLPCFGSTAIFKDEDAISVRKRQHHIHVKGHDDIENISGDYTKKKQHSHDKMPFCNEDKLKQKQHKQGKKQQRALQKSDVSTSLQDITGKHATTLENAVHLDDRGNQVSVRLEGSSGAVNIIDMDEKIPTGTSSQHKKRRRLKNDASEKTKLPDKDKADKDWDEVVGCRTLPGESKAQVNLESEKRNSNWDEITCNRKQNEVELPSSDGWVSWAVNKDNAAGGWGRWESNSHKFRNRWNRWATTKEKVRSWLFEQVM